MASTPSFASVIKTGIATLGTSNTNRNGSGTLETVYTAGTNGSRIDFIKITATGATTAGMIRLFISSGTSNYLYHEIPVFAITPSGSAEVFQTYLTTEVNSNILPIFLKNGESLKASTHNSETFNVIAFGGDF